MWGLQWSFKYHVQDCGGKNLHISGDKSDFGVLTTR